MVDFNEEVVAQVAAGQLGMRGGPWEFNLRDIFRWCQAVRQQNNDRTNPGEFVGLVYADRMRAAADRRKLFEIYEAVFGAEYPLPRGRDPHVFITDSLVQVGSAVLPRGIRPGDGTAHSASSATVSDDRTDLLILQRSLPALETLMHCIRFNWMTIVVRTASF